MKYKILGTPVTGLGTKSHILTGLPVPKCTFPTACPSWLSTPTAFLRAEAEPRGWGAGGWSRARAGVRPVGGSRELTVSTWTDTNKVILR